jgi:hypothetical protein
MDEDDDSVNDPLVDERASGNDDELMMNWLT